MIPGVRAGARTGALEPRTVGPVLLLVLMLLVPPTTSGRAAERPGTPRAPSLDLRDPPAPAVHPSQSPPTLFYNWTNLANATTGGQPSPRAYAAVAFDPAERRTVVFGGLAPNGSALGDTWTLGEAWNWSSPGSPAPPAPRWGASLGFDAASSSLVLYGGKAPNGSYDHDTWEYSGGTWTRVAPANKPPGLAFGLLLPSPNGTGVVLTGGLSFKGRVNATWYFAGGNWTNLTPVVGPAPPGRYGAAGTFFPPTGEDLVVGGNVSSTSNLSGPGNVTNDTWAFDGTTWTRLAGPPVPPARSFGGLAYDQPDGTATLFGGQGNPNGTLPASVWAFNGSRWASVKTTGPAHPHLRYGAALVGTGTGSRGTVLLLGGTSGNGSFFVGLWALGAEAPLVVPPPTASLPSVDTGVPVTLNASPIGGVPPYSYRWSDLPGPCNGTTSPEPRCVPTENSSVDVYHRPRVTVIDSVGHQETSAAGSVIVNGPLTVVRLALEPADVALGGNLTINVTVSGGGNPLRFSYEGLPPGCPSQNLSYFVCVPTTSGDYLVNVTVADPFHRSASGLADVHVTAPFLTGPQLLGITLVVVGVVAIATVVLVGRRRRAPPATGRGRPGAMPARPPDGGGASP